MSRFAIKNNPVFLKEEVDRFNTANPVGSRVTVRLDSGVPLETKTTSPAWTMGGHTNVVKVEGISGGYALARVRPGWDETEH